MNLDPLRQINEQNATNAESKRRHDELLSHQEKTQEIILKSFKYLVEHLENTVTKTVVLNQPESRENQDLTELVNTVKDLLEEAKQIPKSLPEIKKSDYSKDIKALESAIKAVEQSVKEQKLVAEAPVVNVPETTVNVDAPDLAPIEKGMKKVESAVKGIVIPEFKTDNKEVEALLKKTNKLLREIADNPVGGGGGGGSSWVTTNTSGIPVPIELTADGKVPVDAAFSGTIEGAATFSTSADVDKKALVDADRHVQVDVLTMPAVTVDPPVGGATEAAQDEQTALLTTIEANQLPDGHNVTVDNASLAVTGTFWQATQPVSGTVAVTGVATAANQTTMIGHLDGVETTLTAIDGRVDGVEALLTTIDADTSNLSVVGGGTEAAAIRVTLANNSTGVLSVDDNGSTLSIDDGGSTISVDGTVTANLSATDNAVLDSIDTAVNARRITSIGHGVTTVTTAGTDVALAASTACKRVTIQAQTDNTSAVAIGGSGVDATVATGTGILLFPGDTFELEIDNLADIFVDSLVNGEGVRYVWFN